MAAAGRIGHVLGTGRRVLATLAHGAHDTTTAEGRSRERYRRIGLTAASFALLRGLSMILPIVTIRYALSYLGVELYGLWVTITSFFAFFTFADLGLGNGLLTRLSQTWGSGDLEQSRRLTSTAFFLLGGIASVLCLGFFLVYPWIDWAAVLGARAGRAADASRLLMLLVITPQLMQFPFTMITTTQMAKQEGYKSNLWQCVGALLNFLAIISVVKADMGANALVAASACIPALTLVANWIWYFRIQPNPISPAISQFDLKLARSLLDLGFSFFILSILTSFGLAIDNLIVSHLCGLGQVAAFSIASRVSMILTMAIGMISMPMWSANGDALAKGDMEWIRTTTWNVFMISVGLAIVTGICFTAVGPFILRRWLGDSIAVSRWLLLGFALRELMLSAASPFFMVLNGAGRVKQQLAVFAIFTPVATGLKILLAPRFGSAGVIYSMSLVYGTVVLPWTVLRAREVYLRTLPPAAGPPGDPMSPGRALSEKQPEIP